MALTKLTAILNKISSLPNIVRGQATTVKSAFDYDVNVVKDYINDTLIPDIETKYATVEDLQALTIGEFGTNFATEAMMANEMKKDITGGIASYNYLISRLDAISRLFDINFKETLRIKMRQTGLNIDGNTFSDSLEDIVGINTGLSSGYTFDSTNKSLKASVIEYSALMNVLPTLDTPAWSTLLSGTSATIALSSSELNMYYTGAGNSTEYTRTESGITTSDTKRIKARLKVNSSSGGDARIGMSDGAKTIEIGCSASAIYYYNGSGTTNIATGLALTSYFELTVEFSSSLITVYKDGVSIGTVAYIALPSDTNKQFRFGVANQANVTFNYVKYIINMAQGGTATVIWNSIASDSVFTRALIESIASLGTGTIAYYYSRDGGTNFTQCTLGTITSITSQPSGTSIVLKVVITGNAELLTVAWGGE